MSQSVKNVNTKLDYQTKAKIVAYHYFRAYLTQEKGNSLGDPDGSHGTIYKLI